MGMMMVVPHSVIVKIKWEKNIKELSTGHSTEHPSVWTIIKKKLDSFVLILQTRSWGSSGVWTGEMSSVPTEGSFLLHCDSRALGPDLRQF